MTSPLRVQIVVFDGFDELDVFGPLEALSGPEVQVELATLGAPRMVVSDRGIPIQVNFEVAATPRTHETGRVDAADCGEETTIEGDREGAKDGVREGVRQGVMEGDRESAEQTQTVDGGTVATVATQSTSGYGPGGAGGAKGVDGVVVPGGGWFARSERGAWAEARRGDLPARLATFAGAGGWVASVCTGALLLGVAGLLRGRDATTNTHAYDELEAYAGTVVRERVVDAGPVITSNGPSAGIDLGLHLVERFCGTAAADAHADSMDYTRTGRVYYGH